MEQKNSRVSYILPIRLPKIRLCSQFWNAFTHRKVSRALRANRRLSADGENQALRALGAKWLKIIFVMWRDHKPYDENYHLANIARHSMRQAA